MDTENQIEIDVNPQNPIIAALGNVTTQTQNYDMMVMAGQLKRALEEEEAQASFVS